MADLIYRDAVLHDVSTECSNAHEAKYYEAQVALTRAKKIIRDAPAVNRWIPVEDALPEDGQRVLICSKSKRLFDVVFRANAQMPFFDTKIFGKVYAWYCGDVIKWLPLPEPPEKE